MVLAHCVNSPWGPPSSPRSIDPTEGKFRLAKPAYSQGNRGFESPRPGYLISKETISITMEVVICACGIFVVLSIRTVFPGI